MNSVVPSMKLLYGLVFLRRKESIQRITTTATRLLSNL